MLDYLDGVRLHGQQVYTPTITRDTYNTQHSALTHLRFVLPPLLGDPLPPIEPRVNIDERLGAGGGSSDTGGGKKKTKHKRRPVTIAVFRVNSGIGVEP